MTKNTIVKNKMSYSLGLDTRNSSYVLPNITIIITEIAVITARDTIW